MSCDAHLFFFFFLLACFYNTLNGNIFIDNNNNNNNNNNRNQITLWGPQGENTDYASKQWGGLMGTYYKQRWNLFLTMLYNSYKNNTSFDQAYFDNIVSNKVENPWQTNFTQIFPTTSIGDSIQIACQLYLKYNMFGDQTCNYL